MTLRLRLSLRLHALQHGPLLLLLLLPLPLPLHLALSPRSSSCR